ncbi:MAG: hypothetical protein M3N33_00390 [Actinomycetota bacterium]|nr:hypothetical protein [Actinomycetota bacterium]
MGLKDRIRRLEGPRDPDRCPACGGKIIEEEILKDGTVTYPQGGPCEACGSRGSAGRICRIVLDRRDPNDRPAEDDRSVVEWP